MPGNDHAGDQPELLLVGADRPRPLPPGLRASLAEALLPSGAAATDGTADAHPGGAGDERLPEQTRLRLEAKLSRPARTGVVAAHKRWSVAGGLSVAAAIVVVVGVSLPNGGHKGPGYTASGVGNGSLWDHQALAKHSGPQRVTAGPSSSRMTPTAAPLSARKSLERSSPAAAPASKTKTRTGPTRTVGNGAVSAHGFSTGTAPPTGVEGGGAPGLVPRPQPLRMKKSAAGKQPGPKGSYSVLFEPPAAVDAITPASGPASGHAWVVLRGVALTGTTEVSFGSTKATGWTVVSATELRVLVPAHTPGTVKVTVVGEHTSSAVYTYKKTA